MWPFKKKNKSDSNQPEQNNLTWMPVGSGNPFNEPIMDIRSVTLTMVSTTKDPAIAENYTQSRQSIGKEFINQSPVSPKTYETNFSYSHNGAELDGVVFKSPAMEIKWDIYAYGEWFYFVRSWTSDLIFKAKYENTGDALIFREIVAGDSATEEDAQTVHSIMLTHALGRMWPFHIPIHMREILVEDLALAMFSQHGSKATIITHANIFDINLVGQ